MMNALQTLIDNGLTHEQLKSVLEDIIGEDSFDDGNDRRCCVALLHYNENEGECDPNDCVASYGDTVKVAGHEYRVLSDEEAETAFDSYLDQMLDDGAVDGSDCGYFDTDSWRKDMGMDGRGSSLASYDGEENECGEYLLYRVG